MKNNNNMGELQNLNWQWPNNPPKNQIHSNVMRTWMICTKYGVTFLQLCPAPFKLVRKNTNIYIYIFLNFISKLVGI